MAAALLMLSACGSTASDGSPTKAPGGNDAGLDASGAKKSHHDAGAGHDATPPHDAGAPDGGTPAADAAPDVDNGAPSTVYPAPHPAMPQLTNLAGGPIFTAPRVYLVTYPDYPYLADLQTFAANMTQATYWGDSTHEYGVGPLAVGGTIALTDAPPATISSTDIGTWIGTELASGAFGTPDPEGIYTIFYPQATLVTQPNPVISTLAPLQGCVAFGGYHDNVSVSLTDGGTPTNFAYAVIPTCDTNIDDLTAVVSHEWVEASTDPFLTSTGSFKLIGGPDSAYFTVDADHAIWALLGGGEAGDLCEPEGNSANINPTDVGYTVQRTWSNLLAAASHDPCTPDPPSTAFFAAAPVLNDTETVTSTLIGGSIVTKGVTIPVATSKTIEVDLFSDADTNGPWTVSAQDVLYEYYGSYGLEQTLAFAWDRTQGVNGDKLHLTITVTRPSILARAHAFQVTSTQGGRTFVWPGLVVE
jgi:hypothetical protein